MKRIFCLETEWEQSVHDLKKKPIANTLLTFLENTDNVQQTYRCVATPVDFEYYISHLYQDAYNSYDTVYLCFHGSERSIHFADKSNIDLMEFAKKHENIFKGRNVHFGSCSTLRMKEEDACRFKSLTGARMVTGYAKDVNLLDSFNFELWLLRTLLRHPGYAAVRLQKTAQKEMGYWAEQLKFKAI